jgi:RimJ/RimL family protein N-acetyltransferase
MSQQTSEETLPELSRGAIRLREVCSTDAPALTELFSKQEVSAFLSPPPATVEDFTTWIQMSRGRHLEHKAACFTVFVGNNQPAGLFMCVRGVPTEDSAEIGFALAPGLWGTGVFRETADLYVSFLFDRWQLKTLTGRTLARNHRGLGAMRKLGATIVEQTERDGETEFVWQIKTALTTGLRGDYGFALASTSGLVSRRISVIACRTPGVSCPNLAPASVPVNTLWILAKSVSFTSEGSASTAGV